MRNFDFHFNVTSARRIPGIIDTIRKISEEELIFDDIIEEQLSEIPFKKTSQIKDGMRGINIEGKVFDLRHGKVNIYGIPMDGIRAYIGKPESPTIVELSEEDEDIIHIGSKLRLTYGNIFSKKSPRGSVKLFDESPFTMGTATDKERTVAIKTYRHKIPLFKFVPLKKEKKEKECTIAEIHCPKNGEASLFYSEKEERGTAFKISMLGLGGGCSFELSWACEKIIKIKKCIGIKQNLKFIIEIGDLLFLGKKITNYYSVDVERVSPPTTDLCTIEQKKDACVIVKRPKIKEIVRFDKAVKSETILREINKGIKTELNLEAPLPKIFFPPGEVSLSGLINITKSLRFEYTLLRRGKYIMFMNPNCIGYCWKYEPKK